MTRLRLLSLASLALCLCVPGIARAQALYVASPPTTATAPTYTGWTTFTFTDISGSPNDDSGLATLTLPAGFQFTFYGVSYTSFDITTDGVIIFANGIPKACTGSYNTNCKGQHNIPLATPPNGLIAYWWDDNEGASTGQWTVTGSAPDRIFSIKVDGFGTYYGPVSPRTVQIDLHELSGAIEVYYGAITAPDASHGKASVGIEDATGTNGVIGLPCTNTPAHCTNADWPTGKRITYAPAVDPDLLVTDVVGSPLVSTIVAGQPGYQLDVSVTAKNQGQNPASGFGFDLYLCRLPQVVLNDPTKCVLLRSHTGLESLAGHATGTYTETAVQFVKPAAGTFYLGAYLDPPTGAMPNGNVPEALEDNNGGVSMGYIIGIDLLGSVSGPASAGPNEDVPMQVTLQNRGTDPSATSFSFQLWIAASPTLNPTTDRLFHTGTVASIGAGATLPLTPLAKLPMVLPDGQYYFILVIDPPAAGKPVGDVTEIDETNNVAASLSPVTVSASDLTVTDVHVKEPTPPYADITDALVGDDVRVSFSVANLGGATASNFFICLLLSDSPVISMFDQDITPASAPVANLTYVGGESHTFDVDVTLPTTLPSGAVLAGGTYYVGVIVNCHNNVPESNKTNNILGTPLQLSRPVVACVSQTDCPLGTCVDGFCCNTACGSGDPTDCQACSVAAGASQDGTCSPLPTSKVCRPASGQCDLEERCDGTHPGCPAQGFAPVGAACDDGNSCTAGDFCDGQGGCVGIPICTGDAGVPTSDASLVPQPDGAIPVESDGGPAAADANGVAEVDGSAPASDASVVMVADASTTASADGSTPVVTGDGGSINPAPTGCGCATGTSPLSALALAALGLLGRRRRSTTRGQNDWL